VSLANTANRGIAAHLPQRLDALGQEERAGSPARGRQRGLGAGMAATDDDDVEGSGVEHGREF
jgi:hypothetical protein